MREIIHAHRDAKYVAIDHPGAVVVDHVHKMVWVGLDRIEVRGAAVWGFMIELLRRRGEVLGYGEVEGVYTTGAIKRLSQDMMVNRLCVILEVTGMAIETVRNTGYILHTDPRETLECCRTLAPGQPLPTRIKSTPCGPGLLSMKREPLPPRLTRRMKEPAGQRRPWSDAKKPSPKLSSGRATS